MIAPEQVPGHIADLAPYMALACECQVIDFSTRAQYGPWLKTRIDDGALLKGMEQGQRFVMMLVKLGDDDMPAAGEGKERKPYKLSQLAGMLCADPQFWAFIKDSYGEACPDKDTAAQWVREACGVESRSFLDSVEASGTTFRGIMESFDSWKQAHE